MEPRSISQLRAFVRITAKIEDDGVVLRERGPLTSYQTKVPFTEIPDHAIEYRNVSRGWLLATLIAGVLFVHALTRYLQAADPASVEPVVWMGLFLLTAGFNLWGRSARCIGYACGGGNLFFFDLAGDRSPRLFLQQIQRAKDAYLAALYTRQVRLRGEQLMRDEIGEPFAAALRERAH
jgi:hypothetical protein